MKIKNKRIFNYLSSRGGIMITFFIFAGLLLSCIKLSAQSSFDITSSTNTYSYNYNQTPSSLISAGIPPGGMSLQWEQSPTLNDNDFTPIYGATQSSYTFSGPLPKTTYFRRIASNQIAMLSSNIIKYELVSINWENINYIREHDVLISGQTDWKVIDQLPIGDKLQTTTYTDGLGRPLEKISKGTATPSNPNNLWGDVVQFSQYDALGRQPLQYLPYTTTTESGKFKSNPLSEQPGYYTANYNEGFAYSQQTFDNSPLNRVMNVKAPGTSWAAGAGNSAAYDINDASDNVQNFTIGYNSGDAAVSLGAYAANTLYKTKHFDENNKQVIEYTNKSGQVILTKTQISDNPSAAHDGWLCTYYVFDDFGKQRYIIPPKAVVYLDTHGWIFSTDIKNELCFSNEYDSKKRLIVKKSPGADAVYMVYDQRDRLVFTQDGNQRNQTNKKWLAALYDNLDRVTLTGLIDYGSSRESLQAYVDGLANNGSNDGMGVTTSASGLLDLVVTTRNPTDNQYKASNSITFDNGFISEDGANFVAEIGAASVTENNTAAINNNPLPANNNLYTLSLNFYDDYSYSGAKAFSTNFIVDNTIPANQTQAVQKSVRTIGFITGSKVRLLDGGNTFLTTTSFFDERGRSIQLQGDNHKGYNEETTTQYDFAGRVRSSYEVHRFDGTADVKIFTKNTLDLIGRITKISKSINGAQEKDIAAYTYNDRGQLANKKLAPGFAGEDGPQLESLDYSYNIHGSLLGINKDYANSPTREGHYFGMELGYDKAGVQNFTNLQTNGNIAGNAWKTRGDNTIRKYDYSYDNANQLINADFNQRNTIGAGFTKDKMNFTSNYTYDVNGNIKTQNQWGVAPGTSPQQIDQLVYHYDIVGDELTNKLSRIEELSASAANAKLGDFKNGSSGSGVQQYDYDKNANTIKDLNKEVGDANTAGIQYNFMNLPTLVTFKNTNKTIAYVYDAAGNKLRKILDEPANGNNPARHVETDYAEDFVYETVPQNLGGTGVAVLQFFSHEEGRVRKASDGNFVYDYFIKDHLTNVRMILTEEQKQDIYPAATLEGTTSSGAVSVEKNYYNITDGQITENNLISGITNTGNVYQNNNIIPNPNPQGDANANSQKMYKLSSSSQKTGLGIALKVMSGDKIDIFGKSYFTGAGSNSTPIPVADILSGLLGTGAVANSGKGVTLNNLTDNPQLVGGINGLLGNQYGNTPTDPKAYINYIILDEQFNYVGGSFSRTGTAGAVKNHHEELQNINIPQNGYIYIYCSNESNLNVFFDNLQVLHSRGRILEENHLYSYGLRIAAVSTRAAGNLQNKDIYQGDFAEHDDETGLDEFDFRHYDPQIGRWTTMDPIEQFATPYIGMGNNPIMNIDPNGGWASTGLFEGLGTLGKIGVTTLGGAMVGGFVDLVSGGNGWNGMLIGAGVGLASNMSLGSLGGLSGIPASIIGKNGQLQKSLPSMIVNMFRLEYGISVGYNGKRIYYKGEAKSSQAVSQSMKAEVKTVLKHKQNIQLELGYNLKQKSGADVNIGVAYDYFPLAQIDLADFDDDLTTNKQIYPSGVDPRFMNLARVFEHEYIGHKLKKLNDYYPGISQVGPGPVEDWLNQTVRKDLHLWHRITYSSIDPKTGATGYYIGKIGILPPPSGIPAWLYPEEEGYVNKLFVPFKN